MRRLLIFVLLAGIGFDRRGGRLREYFLIGVR